VVKDGSACLNAGHFPSASLHHCAARAPGTRLESFDHDGSGQPSAPILPRLVQTIRKHNERTGVSSGSQSLLTVAIW
jgi:hypothetical protein